MVDAAGRTRGIFNDPNVLGAFALLPRIRPLAGAWIVAADGHQALMGCGARNIRVARDGAIPATAASGTNL